MRLAEGRIYPFLPLQLSLRVGAFPSPTSKPEKLNTLTVTLRKLVARAIDALGAEKLEPGELIYKPNYGIATKLKAVFTPEINVKEVVQTVKVAAAVGKAIANNKELISRQIDRFCLNP